LRQRVARFSPTCIALGSWVCAAAAWVFALRARAAPLNAPARLRLRSGRPSLSCRAN
jgi:hypothetical protein